MSVPSKPSITLLSETNLDERCWHSMLMSLCRGFAALIVAASHVRGETMPSLRSLPDPTLWYQGLTFFTGFAHQAVVVFFVVSGWLVGGSLLNKLHQPNVIRNYCIDRITRLWVVLIPAFLLTLLLAWLSGGVNPSRFDNAPGNEFSSSAFAGNLLGLQDLLVPRFGGNYALWSLAFEMWYYVVFPLALLAFVGRKKTIRVAAAIAALAVASQLSVDILLYFSVWALGVLFSRIRFELDRVSLALLLGLFAVVAVQVRLSGYVDRCSEESFPQDLFYSLLFLVLLSSQQRKFDPRSRTVRRLKKLGDSLSAFSFTLYVMHVPLLLFITSLMREHFGIAQLSPAKLSHLAIYVTLLSVIVMLSYGIYSLFEAHTHKVRALLKQVLSSRTSQRAGATGALAAILSASRRRLQPALAPQHRDRTAETQSVREG